MNPTPLLNELKRLNQEESHRLSPVATLSQEGVRRTAEDIAAYRQQFALDTDRILQSRVYARYIDKTQVFSFVANDHITHKILHVQLVDRLARTIGRFLFLNEDLLEAISLGHDVGHPPFGHVGESFLSNLCQEHGLPPFQHNIQSVRFLDKLERKGRGLNLTLQVLDGILCHDGKICTTRLSPNSLKTFPEFDKKLHDKSKDPNLDIIPATIEGCVVRLANTIAYIGRDIEDAIVLGLIERKELPENCQNILGNTNGTMVHNLVTDLLNHSYIKDKASSYIGFSDTVSDILIELKAFSSERIYMAPIYKQKYFLIRECFSRLFYHYLRHLNNTPGSVPLNVDLLSDIDQKYLQEYRPEEKVRDFISGMTDDFFVKQARSIGCEIPNYI